MRTSSSGDGISGDPERTVSEEVGKGGARLPRSFPKEAGNLNIKRLLLVRETSHPLLYSFPLALNLS